MFIPIGHDQDTVRRLPWVTFTLMGLCLLVYLVTFPSIGSNEKERLQALDEIGRYYLTHPETKVPKEMEDFFLGFMPEFQDQREAFKEVLKEGSRAGGEQLSLAEQQEELDRLVTHYYEVRDQSPYFSLGLVPAHPTLLGFITYQFMHAGFGHLFGNLLFLYLAGPYIEDVWGRPLFAGFYLSAGVLSALVYILKYPTFEGPLIGASGAIAGVMGAFLVRHAGVKIRFLFFLFMTPRIFTAPAWIMLPLWLGREIFFGQVVDMGGRGTGVAHWAHVAGFVYGAVFALVIRQLKFEQKVEKAIDGKVTLHENPILDRAMEEMRHGDKGHAQELLIDYLKTSPGDIDAAAALWDISRDLGTVATAVPFLLTAIRDALRKRDTVFVETRWPEIIEGLPPDSLDPALAARVADILSDQAPPSLLERTVESVRQQVDYRTAPGVLTRLARVGAAVGASSAGYYASLALENPEIPPETRKDLEVIAARMIEGSGQPAEVASAGQLSEDGGATTESSEQPLRVKKVEHVLDIMEAIPRAWDSARILRVEINGKKHKLRVDQVEAIAVGGIKSPGGAPYLLIDLMLDGPWSDRRKLRVIRIRSSSFDPMSLVEGENTMEAFRRLLMELLKCSEATPLPDPDSAVGKPFRRFGSIEEFEMEILG